MTTDAAVRIAAATLRPETSQRAFRAVMDALARPGVVTTLPTADVPPALLPVTALADLGTGICVLDDDGRWADVVSVATNAPPAALSKARLVAAVRPVTAAEVAALCRGSTRAPETAALASLAVSSLERGPQLLLFGPGVAGRREIAPAGLPDGFVATRAHAVADFPAGADLLLVDADGRMLGLPRSTTVSDHTGEH